MGRNDATPRSLLLRLKGNDQDAWKRLVRLYSPLVAHWCRQWGAPLDDAPDLVQDVFAAIAPALATYRQDQPGVTFRGWLRGIARHKVHDHFRHNPTVAEGGSEAMARLQGVPVADGAPDQPDGDAEITALYRRALEQVRVQFEDKTWQAFWRVAIENRSPADIAAELGISANGVRQAKSRILRRLKEELGELIV